jgi:hypothetical protein
MNSDDMGAAGVESPNPYAPPDTPHPEGRAPEAHEQGSEEDRTVVVSPRGIGHLYCLWPRPSWFILGLPDLDGVTTGLPGITLFNNLPSARQVNKLPLADPHETEERLIEAFSTFGHVVRMTIHRSPDRQAAVLVFNSVEAAERVGVCQLTCLYR